MVVSFANNSLQDRPTLVLKNINGVEIQTLGYAFNVVVEFHFNEISKLTFDIPRTVFNGEQPVETPHYADIVGLRMIELVGYGQFILVDPTISNDGIKEIKSCTAYSLEYELTYKQITLEESTYNFYDPFSLDNTILGIILSYCPSWHLGTISTNLLNKYRTFDVSGENVYNFIKGTLQEKYRCVFDFDTYTRSINVISVDDIIATQPIFLSMQNLLKNVKVSEDSENVFTCVEAFGADGVDIRSVNPIGSNKIYNLDYLIRSGHLSDVFVGKWRAWEENFNNSQELFYQLVVEQALQSSSVLTANATLARLDGELTGAEAVQASYASAMAQTSDETEREHYQELLAEAGAAVLAKKTELSNENAKIAEINTELDLLRSRIEDVIQSCAFEAFFDAYVCPYCGGEAIEQEDGTYICEECGMASTNAEPEILVLNRCFKETTLEDASFVAAQSHSYYAKSATGVIDGTPVQIRNSSISVSIVSTDDEDESDEATLYYTITGGELLIGGTQSVAAKIISAAMVQKPDSSFVFSAYLSSGIIGSDAYTSGNITISGELGSVSGDLHQDPDIGGDDYLIGTTITFTPLDSELYFTTDVSAYEESAVAWDLFQYASENAKKLSFPSYTFTVSSANFMAMDDFDLFRKQIVIGKKVYLDLDSGELLEPICTGITIAFDDLSKLNIEFSDTYSGMDHAMGLVDLLEESVSMGKSVSRKSNGWSSYLDSGASSAVSSFMSSALDVAKNKLLSSSGQAIDIDETGLRLRSWSDQGHTVYNPKQIWMTGSNIVFTDDSWNTAKMAIGEMGLEEGGTAYGIIADYIVGKLIAGENLEISNSSGSMKIDGEGVVINGLNLIISSEDESGEIVREPLDEHIQNMPGGINDYVVHVGDNVFLDASKVAGSINSILAKMTACSDHMVYDSTGMWLMNSTSKQLASDAVWMNNSGILIANERDSSDVDDPSYNETTNDSLTWKTAITADGIKADYLIGDHMHATFDISAGEATGTSYDTCPFYVDGDTGQLHAKGADIDGTVDAERLLLGGKDITNLFKPIQDEQSMKVNGLDLGSIGIEDGAITFYDKNLYDEDGYRTDADPISSMTLNTADTSAYAFEIRSLNNAMRIVAGQGTTYIAGGGQNAWIQLKDNGDIAMSSTSNTLLFNNQPIGGGIAVFG